MADHDDAGNDQINLLRYLPQEDSAEGIDALWRQIMVYRAFSDSGVSEARARRADAEAAREKAEQEAAGATRHLCEGMKAEADDQLSQAQGLRSEAERLLGQAESERGRAADLVKEAEDARSRIVIEAQQKASDILEDARKAARQECSELRHQALKEIKAILGRVESVRLAADEELETQRIFSNIARLKANLVSLLARPAKPENNGPTAYQDPEADGIPEAGIDVADGSGDLEQSSAAPAAASSNGKPSAAQDAKLEEPTPKGSKTRDKKAAKS